MPVRSGATSLFAWKPFLAALITAALALVVVASVEWSYQRSQTTLGSMKSSADARAVADAVLDSLIDAEAAQRGTLLTGQERHLNLFRTADRAVTTNLEQLKSLNARLPAFESQIDALDQAVRARQAELKLTLRWHEQGMDTAVRESLASDESLARIQTARRAADTLIQTITSTAAHEHEEVLRTLNLGRLAVHLAALLSAVWLVYYLRNNAALQRIQQEHAQNIAEERDRLESQVKQRTQDLAQLNIHLQTLREGERGTLARSLHDNLGAALTAAKLDVARLHRSTGPESETWHARLQHLAESIDEGIAIKRQVIEELMPSALHNLGLRPALEILINQFRRDTSIETHLSVADIETSEACRNAAFQVVQESLRNVSRFATATTVQVIVGASENAAEISVRDDGAGFDLQQPGSATRSPGNGLSRLRYRVELVGGRFDVFSAPGHGTEVRASVPLA